MAVSKRKLPAQQEASTGTQGKGDCTPSGGAAGKVEAPRGEHWHHARKAAILEAHPEVLSLYGHDYISAVYCLFTVLVQTVTAVYLVPYMNTVMYIFCIYFVSGSINHSLTLAIHELSHDLFLATPLGNKLFGYVANLPLVFPVSATFNRYHNAHHAGLNTEGVDADLPTEFEFRWFDWGRLGRLCWMLLQPLMYGLRPLIEKPKKANKWQVYNLAIQIVYTAAIYRFGGFYGVLYLVLGTALGIGLHPISGHFIAEHYEVFQGQETSSYYGSGNWITYNVGFHVEHHDLPKIPGRLLPKLKAMAPEFYDNLKSHSSWVAVIYNFVMYGSLRSRIRRTRPELTKLHLSQ